MVKEKKTISRSIRMTQTVYDIVNKYEGNGFNEKFENMVLYCFREENRIKAAIKEQQEIYKLRQAQCDREITNINKRIDDKRRVLHRVSELADGIENLLKTIP